MLEGAPDSQTVAGEMACVIASGFCPSPNSCWSSGYCVRSRPKTDAKQPARKKDVAAIRRKLLRVRWCYSCEQPASDGHHIIFRSHGGDDVEDNIAPLCHYCHGILHMQTGYEAERVRMKIGRNLHSPEIEYILDKLGDRAGRDFLSRLYLMGSKEISAAMKRELD